MVHSKTKQKTWEPRVNTFNRREFDHQQRQSKDASHPTGKKGFVAKIIKELEDAVEKEQKTHESGLV